MRAALVALALGLLLLVGCDDGEDTPAGLPGAVTLSGTILFERVPVTAGGLDYGGAVLQPARRIRVELWGADGGFTGTAATTDDLGRYQLEAQGGGSRYRIVAVARMSRAGRTVAEVIKDMSVAASASPVFALGRDDFEQDLLVPSAWTGSGYDEPNRRAGAFAILDTIATVQDAVLAVEPGVRFPELPVVWDTADTGAAYLPDAGFLFLGGLANADTDEYDQHVVAHEYAHFLVDTFARDDSFGGAHNLDDLLDETVAFSEGVASAIACIALDDPVYRDTGGADQGSILVEFDLEDGSDTGGATVATGGLNPAGSGGSDIPTIAVAGSYNELSVAGILWDIYDDDGGVDDDAALGFAPIWSALRDEVRTAASFTTIMPFLMAFGGDADVAALALAENVMPVDEFEDAALGGIGPRYTTLVVDGGPEDTDAAGRRMFAYEEIQFANGDPDATVKFYDWQYLRFDGTGLPMYTLTVTPSRGDPVISQGAGYYIATDSGGSVVPDSIMLDHDGSADVVFRVGPNPTLIVDTTEFTVEVQGPPGG